MQSWRRCRRSPRANHASAGQPPLEHENFAELKDAAFLRAVGFGELAGSLADYWPARGPVWDALGVAIFPTGRPGVVLVEGKSYPAEVYGSGCKATPDAATKIEKALGATQRWLGLHEDPARWTGSLYQSANRLAHLYWLREVAGVEAWLAHVLFVDDRTHKAASRAEWERALPDVDRDLGIDAVDLPYAGHAFLPALAATELTAAPRLA